MRTYNPEQDCVCVDARTEQLLVEILKEERIGAPHYETESVVQFEKMRIMGQLDGYELGD